MVNVSEEITSITSKIAKSTLPLHFNPDPLGVPPLPRELRKTHRVSGKSKSYVLRSTYSVIQVPHPVSATTSHQTCDGWCRIAWSSLGQLFLSAANSFISQPLTDSNSSIEFIANKIHTIYGNITSFIHNLSPITHFNDRRFSPTPP